MNAVTTSSVHSEIIELTEQLLTAINTGDYNTYVKLVDPNVTSFEPEALGNLISGLDFHKYYFDNLLKKNQASIRTSILSPVVHKLGNECACIAYVRFTQYIDKNGLPHSQQSQETRVWHKEQSNWKMIHFHRTNEQVFA